MTNSRITEFLESTEDPWVHGAPPFTSFEVVTYDPSWPDRFRELSDTIEHALGSAALHVEHIGSTSVPGMDAKPVIDIDLTVADPSDEPAYVPQLEALGYDLVIREPRWYEHRCLSLVEPRVNLHVFGPGCPEASRHILFRDWLTTNADDRTAYAAAKYAALDAQNVQMYNARKQAVVRAIYARAFRAAGLLPA